MEHSKSWADEPVEFDDFEAENEPSHEKAEEAKKAEVTPKAFDDPYEIKKAQKTNLFITPVLALKYKSHRQLANHGPAQEKSSNGNKSAGQRRNKLAKGTSGQKATIINRPDLPEDAYYLMEDLFSHKYFSKNTAFIEIRSPNKFAKFAGFIFDNSDILIARKEPNYTFEIFPAKMYVDHDILAMCEMFFMDNYPSFIRSPAYFDNLIGLYWRIINCFMANQGTNPALAQILGDNIPDRDRADDEPVRYCINGANMNIELRPKSRDDNCADYAQKKYFI